MKILSAMPVAGSVDSEPVGHLDGLDVGAEFMSMELRKLHAEKNSSTPKDYTIPVYTNPQPDRVAELEAKLNIAVEALEAIALHKIYEQDVSATAGEALEKIGDK